MSSGNVALTGVRVQRSENNSINFGMDMGSWPAVWWVENSLIKALGNYTPPTLLTLSYCISFPSERLLILAYFEAGLKILFLVLHHMPSSVRVTGLFRSWTVSVLKGCTGKLRSLGMYTHVYAHVHVCLRACGEQSFCIEIIHVLF